MRLKFDANQEFQHHAINSVVDMFEGQHRTASVSRLVQTDLLGIYPNHLDLTPSEIQKNVQRIQERNKIQNGKINPEMDFSVEMETGTGKTYVYLRTILELNRRYGFKKFIIIVPSVAIREGVLKTLDITKSHFRELYDNIPYRYYEYVSKNLSQVKNFAQSSNLEIMVMTMGSFNRDANILYMERDQMWGEKAISYLQKTNPILILDEPQNMEGEVTKDKLQNFNALCRLRYSATHRNPYNLMHRLTPYDAYQMGLVKKIEVHSVTDTDEDVQRSFINLLGVSSKRTKLKAQIEVLARNNQSELVKKKTFVEKNDDVQRITQNADYRGYVVSGMQVDDPAAGRQGLIKFENGIEVRLGEHTGRAKEDIMREQIRETITQHIEKRRLLKPKGIKVLSLFFIDRVDSYVKEDGFIRKTFDRLFGELKVKDKELRRVEAKDVREGYFAQKNGDYLQQERSIEENKEAFDLIMKRKERLLSFDEEVEFIFSHSALKEGWDNPNIFNICTLNTTVSTMKKRQEIGRGMRLCVNQEGERVFDRNVNLLSVVANESYSDYISRLQTEYQEDGIYDAPPVPLNARRRKTVRLRKGFERDHNFKDIWERISCKTNYEVQIETERLVKDATKRINELVIRKREIAVTSVTVAIGKKGVTVDSIVGSDARRPQDQKLALDIVNTIKDATRLTRKTVVEILKGVQPELIFRNPERFIGEAIREINQALITEYISQITYHPGKDRYPTNSFEGMIAHDASIQPLRNPHKSIYDAVVFESEPERNFTIGLDSDERVKLFIKLPDWFRIETPIGGYTPDWAILTIKGKEAQEKLYFVIETKSTTEERGRRVAENEKIRCAKRHFEVIRVQYKDVADYSEFEALIR